MPNRLFQGVINQMRDTTDRVIGVVDESGTVISCSELPLIGEVRKGVIADTIVKTAHEEDADLIVMFTDGVQNISELVFGSITQRVLKNTDIDLLSVRK